MLEPGIMAWVGDKIPYSQRGRAMGIVVGALIASTLLGVPIGAYVAQLVSWRWTFWGIGAAALLMLIPMAAFIPPDGKSGAGFDSQPARVSASRVRSRAVEARDRAWLAAGLHFLRSTSFGFGHAALNALIAEIKQRMRGTVMALNSSVMYAGMLAASSASTVLLKTGKLFPSASIAPSRRSSCCRSPRC
jgi:hypothetical protein